LVEIEPPRRDPEIAVRGGVNAVGAGAQIDPVQIDFEDLVLGEPMFEPQCQQGFADFAREAPLGCQEQVLCQLLGDRAAAFDDAAGGEIGQRRARQLSQRGGGHRGGHRRSRRGRHLAPAQVLLRLGVRPGLLRRLGRVRRPGV